MIIKTELIKQVTNKILNALDTSEHTILTDTLEIVAKDNMLCFNVTNKEYYVRINIKAEALAEFHATVNANMFLKLISQITTDTVTFTVTDKVLEVEGNGKFKIPLMLAFDKPLELPEIKIDNVTQQFSIPKDILFSICNYNSREIIANVTNDILRKSYYIDNQGCITYTTGACLNNFSLAAPIKLILGSKIVKLFKLFNDESVLFEMGFNQIGEILQTRIKLSDSSVSVAAVTYSSDGLIGKYPADYLREQANMIYPYSTVLNRVELAQALNRFEIFSNYDTNDTECNFTFMDDTLIIENNTGDSETMKIGVPIGDTYKARLDLFLLKNIVDASKDGALNIKFGNHHMFVIEKGSISNLLPEADLRENE